MGKYISWKMPYIWITKSQWCGWINNEEFLNKFPLVKKAGLKRVYMYYDGKTNDLQLTRRLADDAVNSGGVVKENCRVISIEGDDKVFTILY